LLLDPKQKIRRNFFSAKKMAKAKFGRDGQRKLAPHAIVVFKKGFDVFYIAKHIRDKATNRRETYLCELIQ